MKNTTYQGMFKGMVLDYACRLHADKGLDPREIWAILKDCNWCLEPVALRLRVQPRYVLILELKALEHLNLNKVFRLWQHALPEVFVKALDWNISKNLNRIGKIALKK